MSSDFSGVFLIGGDGPRCFAVFDGLDDAFGDEGELFSDIGYG